MSSKAHSRQFLHFIFAELYRALPNLNAITALYPAQCARFQDSGCIDGTPESRLDGCNSLPARRPSRLPTSAPERGDFQYPVRPEQLL
jgi:hypothetical protein